MQDRLVFASLRDECIDFVVNVKMVDPKIVSLSVLRE